MTENRSFTINKVCTEPFPDTSVKTELVGEGQFKVAKLQNTKRSLVRLKVLKECLWYLPSGTVALFAGDTVSVRASEYASPWGTEVFEDNGTKFVLIPCERIEFIERPHTATTQWSFPYKYEDRWSGK